MSNKSIIIVSGIAVITALIVAGIALYSRSTPSSPNLAVVGNANRKPVEPETPVCPAISQEQQRVFASLAVEPGTKKNETRYRVVLDSHYPANVAKIAFVYDSRSLKFDHIDSSTSVFPIEAPGSSAAGQVVSSRGISGQGAGLLGTGEFGVFVFTNVRKNSQATVGSPGIDVEQSAVYLNNGCAAKGTIQIKN